MRYTEEACHYRCNPIGGLAGVGLLGGVDHLPQVVELHHHAHHLLAAGAIDFQVEPHRLVPAGGGEAGGDY